MLSLLTCSKEGVLLGPLVEKDVSCWTEYLGGREGFALLLSFPLSDGDSHEEGSEREGVRRKMEASGSSTHNKGRKSEAHL